MYAVKRMMPCGFTVRVMGGEFARLVVHVEPWFYNWAHSSFTNRVVPLKPSAVGRQAPCVEFAGFRNTRSCGIEEARAKTSTDTE